LRKPSRRDGAHRRADGVGLGHTRRSAGGRHRQGAVVLGHVPTELGDLGG